MQSTRSASIFLKTSTLLLSSQCVFAQNNTSDDASSSSKNNLLYVLIPALAMLVVFSGSVAMCANWLDKRKKQRSVNPLFPPIDVPVDQKTETKEKPPELPLSARSNDQSSMRYGVLMPAPAKSPRNDNVAVPLSENLSTPRLSPASDSNRSTQ